VLDFSIDGVAYKARNMDVFTQMKVLSKLSPLLASGFGEIIPLIKEARTRGVASLFSLPLEETVKHLAPVAEHLAKMSDEDRLIIVGSSLALVEKEVKPDVWAGVWNAQAGHAMFREIDENLTLMLRLVFAVLQGTFSRFFPASPSK